MASNKPLKKFNKIGGNDKVSGKSAVLLHPEIKKMLTKRSSLVYFDYDKSDNRLEEEKKIAIANSQEKKFNINIVSHPLDVYRSPYLMDLSKSKFIERVSSTTADIAIGYRELPLGGVASKVLFLEFWSWENSETLAWFKGLFSKIKSPSLRRMSLAPELDPRQLGGRDKILATIKQIAIINLILFLGEKFYQSIMFCYAQLLRLRFLWRDGWLELKDEEQEIVSENKQFSAIKPRGLQLQDDVPYMEIYRPSRQPKNNKADSRRAIIGDFGLKFRNLALKPLLVFIAIAFAIVLPVKAVNYFNNAIKVKSQVMDSAQKGLQGLNVASDQLQSLNIKEAMNYLAAANQEFVTAKSQLSEIQSFLTFLAEAVPAKNSFKSGKNLLELGDNLSAAGEHLLKGTESLTGKDDFSLTSKLKNFRVEAQEAYKKLAEAGDNLSNIDVKHLPEENRNKFNQLKVLLPKFIKSLDQVITGTDFAVKIFGDNELKRYLLIFQNDNELRASGGFMGSFALLDLEDGRIKNIELPQGGTYDVRAGMKELVMPPRPLQLINSRWEFQDTNWWPDWPTSAKNIKWFYNKSGGPTIDGVIAINSDWLGRLLAVLGPITTPDKKLTINADNFEYELQKSIEMNSEEKNKPKKILALILPKIIDGLFNSPPERIPELAATLYEGLQQKDIMMYFTDEEIQKFAASNNWDASIKPVDKGVDYLNVVSTNIGGGKTDNVIKQKIFHQSKIEADGSVTVNLLISRYDYGPTDPYFTKQMNNSYLRVYVPAGSILVKAVGFNPPSGKEKSRVTENLKELESLQAEDQAEIDLASQTRIYQEDDKTVFANWSTLGPGENKEILLVYKLPYKINLDQLARKREDNFFQKLFGQRSTDKEIGYQLVVQTQSGAEASDFTHEVVYPVGYEPIAAYPKDNIEAYGGKVVFSDVLKADAVYYLGLKK